MKKMLAASAAVVVLVSVASAQTGTQKAGDEAAIRKLAEEYAAAWNSGNARQAASLFAEDGSFTLVDGQTITGRNAIEKDLMDEIGTAKTGRTLAIETDTVHFLQPDVAVATGKTRFSGGSIPAEQGGGHYMSIVKRVGSEWKVAAVHTAINAPPAAALAPRPTGTSGTAGADTDALLAVEREWAEAVLGKDTAALSRILADDYTEVDPAGMARTKESVIADTKSGDVVFESFTPSEVEPRVYGDTAVVTGVSVVKGSYKGEDISGKYRWTDTFVKRDGRWQAVASQATQVVEEKK